jgi:hypothetical protein
MSWQRLRFHGPKGIGILDCRYAVLDKPYVCYCPSEINTSLVIDDNWTLVEDWLTASDPMARELDLSDQFPQHETK